MKKVGWRKVIVFTEGLVAFCFCVIMMELKEPAGIYAIGSMIIGLVGATIYGNVKSKQVANGNS
jgi:hypothetical protein